MSDSIENILDQEPQSDKKIKIDEIEGNAEKS